MNKYQNNLARTAVEIGVNIQPGQKLFINSPIETAEFARTLAGAAFEAGAGDVFVHYTDENLTKIRYEKAEKDVLCHIPEWVITKYNEILKDGGAVISISAAEPGLFAGINGEKLKAVSKAKQAAAAAYNSAIMANKNRWCVISVPSAAWAVKVFPQARTRDQALELLWSAIIRATHSSEHDAVAYWRRQDNTFKRRSAILNEKQYDRLHYKNSLGTDLTVGLPKNHNWSGGSEVAQDGVVFFPNLPTEEIFSAPDKERVDGHLVSSYPLIYQGRMIDHFHLDFRKGKVVGYSAKTGQDVLEELITSDDGAEQLGEIALVPNDSPISKMDLLFYNTLFDENASCHFAFGAAYPGCVKGGEQMSEEELSKSGLNQSRTHVDFMVGTDDLEITGILPDGTEELVFKDGNFVF